SSGARGHLLAPVGRTEPTGNIRYEAGRAGTDTRPVPANRLAHARTVNQRTLAADRGCIGQVLCCPLDDAYLQRSQRRRALYPNGPALAHSNRRGLRADTARLAFDGVDRGIYRAAARRARVTAALVHGRSQLAW